MEVKLINTKDHQTMIAQVVDSLRQLEGDVKVTFITRDGRVSSPTSSLLRLMSSVFRDLLPSSTLSSDQQVFITISDFSSRSVNLFINLLNNQGAIREPLSKAEIDEVVDIAAIFNVIIFKDRDVTPLKVEFNAKPNIIENIKSKSITSIADVKQEVQDCVIEDAQPTNRKYFCKFCPTETASSPKMRLHYAHKHFSKWLITQANKYDAGNKTCKLCNKPFKTGQQFNLHIGLKHRVMDEILGQEDLTGHIDERRKEVIQINNNKKGQTCQLCSKTSKGLGALYQHYSNAHLSKEIVRNFQELADFKNFKCLLCGKKFRQKNGLIIHLGANHLLVNSLLAQKGLEELEVRGFKSERNAGGEVMLIEHQNTQGPPQDENIPFQEVQVPLLELNSYYLNAFDLNVLTD